MRALLTAVALLLAGAPAAYAGGANGLLVSNYDWNCFSLTTPNPYQEPMISAIAGWTSAGEMAVGGEPFDAEFSIGVVGRSCSGADVAPTVIAPAGVRVAVDAAHPIQWRYPDTNQAWQTGSVRQLDLPDGTTKLLNAGEPGRTTWPIANDRAPLQFRVPLVADRELRGANSGPGQCVNGPPCAPSEAGDYLQVKVEATIGTPLVITPVVALFSTPPPPAAATGLSVAASVSAKAFAKGVAVKVQAAKGAKLAVGVTVKQGKKTVTVARASGTAKADGTTTLRVKRTAAGRSLLGRRTLKATLTLVATGTGLSRFERATSVRIRR